MAEPYYPTLNKKPYFPEHNDNALEVFGKGLVSGFLNVGAGLVGTAEFLAEQTPWVEQGNFLEDVRKNIQAEEKEWETDPQGKVQWVANVVGQAVPYMGSALAGHAAVGVLGSMGIGFAVEGQEAYDEAIARGESEGTANWERGIVGGVNAMIEAFQMGSIMKFADKGKHTFKAFRKHAAKKAWDKVYKEGIGLTKDLMVNSIEEAAEEFLQEGVSVSVPYFLEGAENFGNQEYFEYIWSNKDRLGAAALGGAVVSPFLGLGRAAIPSLAGPSVDSINQMKQRVTDSKISTEEKAALMRDIDKFSEKYFGEIPEFIAKQEKIGTEEESSQETIKERISLIDRAEDKLQQWEDTRPEYEAGIKEESGKRFGEVENFIKQTMSDTSLDPRARVALALSFMKGKMGQQYTKFLDQGFTVEDHNALLDTAMRVHQDSATDFLKSVYAINKMFVEGAIPERNELKSLEPIFGKSFVKKAVEVVDRIKSKPKTRGQKILGQIRELFNFPRAVLASLDFSAIGRQGALVAFMKPKAWIKGVTAGYRAFFSEDYADFIDLSIKTHRHYALMKKSGVFQSERGALQDSEEYFASKVAHAVPGVKASERAYVTSLNVMRAHAFYNIASQWVGAGKPQEDYKELAKVLNHITGRGSLGALKKLGPALNIMFFAPKLQIARVETFTDLIPIRDGKLFVSPTQKILAFTLAKAFGTGMLILWMLSKRKGVKVEHDPRSSDFGKIRIGDTRIDFWGGYSQMMRLVANMATGEMKSTTTGEKYGISPIEVGARYLQTKLSPVAGAALDAYRQEDFKGSLLEPNLETVSKQFYQRFTPLFLQDTADALYYQGLTPESVATSGLALHGIGAMTYPVSDSSQAKLTKNHYAKEAYGVNWSELGPISQQMLRLHNPLIAQTEREARRERLGKKAKARVIAEQRKSERKITRALKPAVRKELDRLLVPVGGLGRRLSEDWYLNDQKYK